MAKKKAKKSKPKAKKPKVDRKAQAYERAEKRKGMC